MTQGEYPYPPDEFDAVDPSAGPRGVHRRPRSRWGAVWPYLVALVVSGALAYVVIGFVWDERGVPSALAPSGTSEEVAETPAETPAGTPGESPTEDPADPAETEPAPSATTPPAPEPEPDLGTPVTVLNSTSVVGLAADAAAQLEDAGWTEVAAGNFTGGALPASAVRYAPAELEPSARAVATELGITAVELAESDATDGIEVVLELDFAG